MQTALRCAAIVSIAIGFAASADTVVPTKGQTPEQIQKDTADCQVQACKAIATTTSTAT